MVRLRKIANSESNLCFTDKDFNAYKNVFLEATVANDFDPTVTRLRAHLSYYYDKTSDKIESTHQALLRAGRETNNAIFWAVSLLLRENLDDFRTECSIAARGMMVPNSLQYIDTEVIRAWNVGLTAAMLDLPCLTDYEDIVDV